MPLREILALGRSHHPGLLPSPATAGGVREQDPGGVWGGFWASWLRFSKNIPSKSLIA